MAESTEKKGKIGKKSKDSFNEDLDSMLDGEDGNQQQVGLLDDDDAIDRLLVGDVFTEESEDEASDTFADIDRLIAGSEHKSSATAEHDEFGDDDIDNIIAGLDINPKPAEGTDELTAELPELDTVAEEVDLSALETVGEVDELPDVAPTEIQVEAEDPVTESKSSEFDSMSEIDEFGDESTSPASDNADFLLADFNISADDQAAPMQEAVAEQNAETAPDVTPEAMNTEMDEFAETEVLAQEPASDEIASAEEFEPDEATESEEEKASAETVPPQPMTPPAVDYAPQLAALAEQFNELKKLQKQTHHDLQFKADNEALNACLETVDTLQTEQKKTKRNLDGLLNKKPVGVYIANGVAGLAILIAVGLAIEAFITKSQVTQLVEIIGQLKQQAEAAPTADAADKELLRKQLDELTVAQGVASSQIAELSKALHGDAGGEKPSGDFGNKLADLNNQDMQMGAAIEALQTKVAALEKGKTAAAVTAKPAPKKPAVVEENWAVNLVAFKQDWYAKRKADEFAGKGVPAKVSRADNKGETWYRLSVDGFKSQYEAAAYAAKVKKTLNLDSVWVAKNKD